MVNGINNLYLNLNIFGTDSMKKLLIVSLVVLISSFANANKHDDYSALLTLFNMTDEMNSNTKKSVCMGFRQMVEIYKFLDKNPDYIRTLTKREKDNLAIKIRQYNAMVNAYRVGDNEPNYCKVELSK